MAEIVYGDQSISEVMRNLVRMLEPAEWDGTLYIGYPVLTNVEGTVRVDALYVSQSAGVVVFDTAHLDATRGNGPLIAEISAAQDRYFAAINAKLLESPDLLVHRRLIVPITVISLSSRESFNIDAVVVSTPEDVLHNIPNDANLEGTLFETLNAIIERTATIRPKKRRANVKKHDSRGAILKEIEKNIANLDAWQKRAAIELPNGPQRIRGLAGSGKTIVIALKAAYLHSKDPSLRIVVTFQTRSLYQQFKRLVAQFCFEFSKMEPDWTRITSCMPGAAVTRLACIPKFAKRSDNQCMILLLQKVCSESAEHLAVFARNYLSISPSRPTCRSFMTLY
jgi:superfamily I DNA and RNA helicase